MAFQSGPGSQVASSYCVICHSAEYVYMQPPHPPEKWNEIVWKMKQAFGCPIPKEDISTLVDYLVGQNSVQPALGTQNAQQPVSPVASEGASSANGKTVFNTYCMNCHGETGKGDGPIGKSLVPPAANLTQLQNKSDDMIRKTIQNGRPGTAMPSWKNDLSPQDIQDVLAYIRHLSQ
jgi:mono/diheme cytochrome c family protein